MKQWNNDMLSCRCKNLSVKQVVKKTRQTNTGLIEGRPQALLLDPPLGQYRVPKSLTST